MSSPVCRQDEEQDPHQLTVHYQTLDSANYLGVELTETSTWGNTFSQLLQKPTKHLCIQEHEGMASCCLRHIVHPVLEYASIVWDRCQKDLKSTLEMAQRWSACCILHSFSPTSSTSHLATQLQLENLHGCSPGERQERSAWCTKSWTVLLT